MVEVAINTFLSIRMILNSKFLSRIENLGERLLFFYN